MEIESVTTVTCDAAVIKGMSGAWTRAATIEFMSTLVNAES
jgi:hypothetical protein